MMNPRSKDRDKPIPRLVDYETKKLSDYLTTGTGVFSSASRITSSLTERDIQYSGWRITRWVRMGVA